MSVRQWSTESIAAEHRYEESSSSSSSSSSLYGYQHCYVLILATQTYLTSRIFTKLLAYTQYASFLQWGQIKTPKVYLPLCPQQHYTVCVNGDPYLLLFNSVWWRHVYRELQCTAMSLLRAGQVAVVAGRRDLAVISLVDPTQVTYGHLVDPTQVASGHLLDPTQVASGHLAETT